MKCFLLDANVLLRFLLDDIPEQSGKAAQLLSKAKDKKVIIFVPQIVIFEVSFILEKYYKFTKEKVISGIEIILETPYLEIQDQGIFQKALEVYKGKNIDFVDCFLACSATEKGIELFTFDRNLTKLIVYR